MKKDARDKKFLKKNKMKKLKNRFFRQPRILVADAKALHEHPQVNLIAVSGSEDKPVGRGKKISSPATIDFLRRKTKSKYFKARALIKTKVFIIFVNKKSRMFLSFLHSLTS